ncbi:lytic murein transglycosylase [Pseudoponticoccus marisrubri]|uniref:Murein transglycosylase n=1 Tax=Pseudoponticoccus marisrubri TaxID=1685382 RepID=A0A0W7WJ85_9RHOB|nr:lytic murein transglycosylase [Pseudoponticoccus marisrubri]KUF10606.1 murein transglycosylase [Pseudoponticoccus marisrubri]
MNRSLVPWALCAAMGVGPVCAGTVEVSLRPKARPVAVAVEEIVGRAVMMPDFTVAPARSLRPRARPAALLPKVDGVDGTEAGFRAWTRDFRPRALRQGISARVFDAAFAGVRFDPRVVARDRSQSEFSKTIWDYLDSAVSDTRVSNGRAALRRHGPLLNRIEARYGVEKEVVLAVWGMETNYGSFRGEDNVIRSMASLAYDGRRARFFETQLVAALRILQSGDTTPARMKGSWAGAMGHTQFMPTSFEALAVDFTGDGRRDIWGEDPADALASTANYLARNGWVRGLPWGVEVQLPRGFDYGLVGSKTKRMPSAWARLGVTGMDGRPVRDFGSARLFLPAGHKGAAFLVFKNFDVIRRYNPADAYAMGVGHLAERIAGGPKIRGGWPRDDRALTRAERMELQRRLTAAGFNTHGVDARIGPRTVAALRAFQRSRGLVPDGHASLDVLKRLR